MRFALTPYIQIARFDHWFKNIFMFPGVVVALYAQPDLLSWTACQRVFLALVATGIVASSNYILNELLDAKFDALHPVKKSRPIPSGLVNKRIVVFQWLAFATIGFVCSAFLGAIFFYVALSLWIMGCIYNIPPIRSKDKPYFDVLSESVNNPIRLLLGWYATGITILPPTSLLLAYWMVGAFFMAIKRLAEFRMINNPQTSAAYRQSFAIIMKKGCYKALSIMQPPSVSFLAYFLSAIVWNLSSQYL
jgi:decaprenyl-phosphate phosphoribosyltransferase